MIDFLKKILHMGDAIGTDLECLQSLRELLRNLMNPDLDDSWALKMMDAGSKIPSGLLSSLSFNEMGNFDECIAIRSIKDEAVKPQYCLGRVATETFISLFRNFSETPEEFFRKKFVWTEDAALSRDQLDEILPSGPTLALCIPNQCNPQEINNLIKLLSLPFQFECQTQEDVNPPLSQAAMATIIFFLVWISIIAGSTIYDFTTRNRRKDCSALSAFSIYTNGQYLFRFRRTQKDISCMDGLRFISLLWIMLFHVSVVEFCGPLTNTVDVAHMLSSLQGTIIASGTLAADTFLLMSGTLVAYGFVQTAYSTNNINIYRMYIHRFVRLTSSLAPLVFVCSHLVAYMGSGPYWPKISTVLEQPCQKYWWSSLLHVQNYVNNEQMCLDHTWYIDVDWQLFLLSPLILIPLWKFPKTGICILLSMISGSIGFLYYWANANNLAAIKFSPSSVVTFHDFQTKYFTLTHTRMTPYLIGILVGYFLAKIKLQKSKLSVPKNKFLLVVSWMICLTVMATCIFGPYISLMGPHYDKTANTLYIAFARPTWALCVAFLVVACTTGYGGPINAFLSIPLFQFFHKFSYSMFLVHLPIIYMREYSTRQGTYVGISEMISSLSGNFVYTFVASVFFVLVFEFPIAVLEKLLGGRIITQDSQETKIQKQEC